MTLDDKVSFAAEPGDLTSFALAGGLGGRPRRASVDELPEVLCARYRLEGVLGAGGMGVVFRARDLLHEQFGEPDPFVAVKLLSDDFNDAPDAASLLYSEFALTRHLRHPNVIRVDAFEWDPHCQQAFITQELMRGSTLEQVLCEHPAGLPPDKLQLIATALLDALAYTHERGVLHGDLKPSNMMLTEDGPRLFDFGLGHAVSGVMDGLPRLSRERFKAWTPNYAAPELLAERCVSTQTDIFAMGCVLYELACAKTPYGRISPIQARTQRRWSQLRAPANLPIRFWPALRMALALEANTRTISARELLEAFNTRPIGRMEF